MDHIDFILLILCISALGVTIFVLTRPKLPKETPCNTSPTDQHNLKGPESDLRRQALQLHIPEDAVERFTEKYMADGLSEELALRKLIEDTIRDRARYQA
jgi:hypothetical protein